MSFSILYNLSKNKRQKWKQIYSCEIYWIAGHFVFLKYELSSDKSELHIQTIWPIEVER